METAADPSYSTFPGHGFSSDLDKAVLPRRNKFLTSRHPMDRCDTALARKARENGTDVGPLRRFDFVLVAPQERPRPLPAVGGTVVRAVNLRGRSKRRDKKSQE